jgi:ApaG protein
MSTATAVTRGVRVQVECVYNPERSNPRERHWFFVYRVTITNEGDETVQLVSRRWEITDGDNHMEEVQGPGVVGKKPVLAPGQSFTYSSGCPLPTPFGMMEGTYQMVSSSGERFDVKIPAFALTEPYTAH